MELRDELLLALYNLVNLKEHKDKHGKDEFYEKNQPKAWEFAKQVLKECEGKDNPNYSGNCIKPDVTASVRPKCQKPEDYRCVKLHGGCCRDLNCEYWR